MKRMKELAIPRHDFNNLPYHTRMHIGSEIKRKSNVILFSKNKSLFGHSIKE